MAEGMKPELLQGGWRHVLASFKTLKQSRQTLNAKMCVSVCERESIWTSRFKEWLTSCKESLLGFVVIFSPHEETSGWPPAICVLIPMDSKTIRMEPWLFYSNVLLTFVDNASAEHHPQHQVNEPLSPVSTAYLETTKRHLMWRSKAVGERNENCVLAQVIVLAEFTLAACENCKCNISNPKSHQALIPSFIQGHSLSS